MVTALGGSAAAAATVLHASIEIPAAARIGSVVIDEGNMSSGASRISASGALSTGEAEHV